MAEDAKKNSTINKTDTGFPSYLDFEKLRAEGIAYLGKLSGKLWTDHNVHDPGITILEELCYAVLDLGYRTNLPVEDILAREPGSTTTDDNFFTPAEILTCNPLTITDYRKMLIDIPGIKNAWLQPATDRKDYCRPQKPAPVPQVNNPYSIAVAGAPVTHECSEYLNGLYHVYLETEKDLPEDSTELKELLARVRNSLMAHRNLCEDFEDIFILCKLEMGVCASIEIEDNANAENVYVAVANKLRNFFSPAPVFYTLPQLLEKGKTVEEIFSGRPYRSESHGFIDTDEMENIRLKKEIHTSDVYNAIFDIPGVRKISHLRLRNCGKECGDPTENKSSWRFHIPENHIPSFSISCSGFEFTRNGLPVSVDTEKFATLLELSFTHTNQVTYKSPSPYLGDEIPQGIFHSDLESYYSIQNDFPRVYGIGDGGLPDSASNERKAKALQLKAYLLFFDQLLANYLSQLKNIRNLFRLRNPGDAKNRHTYFSNTLQTVPQLDLLTGSDAESNSQASDGTAMVYPVWKEKWENTLKDQLTAEEIFQAQRAFSFDDLNSMDEASSGLRDELINDEEIAINIFRSADDCWLYTISSSAEKWILLGKKARHTGQEALQQANAVKYLAVFEKNYRSFLTAADRYTFNIEMNLFSYADFLAKLTEDEELYNKRRKDMLSHLLARFAEKFTAFSLLNWKAGYENKALTHVENYLSKYDDISRNRGRAYDYRADGWGNDNISGYERKLKSLAGIEAMQKNYVCPFTVDLYDEQYVLDFGLSSGAATFRFSDKFDLYEDAVNTAAAAITAMAGAGHYQLQYNAENKKYRILLNFGAEHPAVYTQEYNDSHIAEEMIAYLSNCYQGEKGKTDITESSWTWKVRLTDSGGHTVKTALSSWHTPEEASKGIETIAGDINNPKIWVPSKEIPASPEYYYDKNIKGEFRFVDLSAFKIDIDDTIIDKPGEYTYEVLDKNNNSFKLSPTRDFDNPEAARQHCYSVLAAAADIENLQTGRNQETKRYIIEIRINGKTEAVNEVGYKSKPEAEKDKAEIVSIIQKHCCRLRPEKKADTWKFRVQFKQDAGDAHSFSSKMAFKSRDEADKAARLFLQNTKTLDLSVKGRNIEVSDNQNKNIPVVSYEAGSAENPPPIDVIREALEKSKELDRMATAQADNRLKEYIKVDAVGKYDSFVYKLISKNNVPAYFAEEFRDETAAKAGRKELAARSKQAQRRVPEICLGGDIFREVKDKDNNICYRYKIKLYYIPDVTDSELVLFESAGVYQSQDEANQAFQENYLILLKFASDKNEYGKTISITPLTVIDKDECTSSEAKAFIPAETLTFLVNQLGSFWPARLAEYIKTYPIKIIDADSKEFAALFCRDWSAPAFDCADNKTNWVYYFSLPVNGFTKTELKNEWRSTSFFTTPAEAMTMFRYFARLLKYTGNYFADCGCSKMYDPIKDNISEAEYSYKIFIREVLAQSINWFEQPGDAWGSKGIEKFISAVQAGNAIQHHQRKQDGCYSFYYTCGTGLLGHPCKYDTAKRRNKVMNDLYNFWKRQADTKAYTWSQNGKQIILSDANGKPFAAAGTDKFKINDFCAFFTALAEQISIADLIIDKQGKDRLSCMIRVDEKEILLQSVEEKNIDDPEATEKWSREWKNILFNWACYFPVTRTKTDGGAIPGQYKYCIEIKLPGFSSCAEDEELNIPCICRENKPAGQPACYIAWKGNCCYTTCQEAMEVYKAATDVLNDKKNYQASFDCECNSFGINLHTQHPALISPQNPQQVKSDVIAINPQCYDTPDESCAAASVAEKLINSEGLHLAEHILLRPHSEKDCSCKCIEQLGSCNSGCNFPPYPSGDKDPCSEMPANICFRPGTDPYSFMATMILPAWSQRFRQESNRQVLEKLIYQEAPAHVLIRILWLKPYDFCLLETGFKNWNRWLAGKKSCANGFDPCQMTELLFCRSYKCLEQNDECKPCEYPGGQKILSCMEEEKKKLSPEDIKQNRMDRFKFLNQVNEVFCMEEFCAEKKVYKDQQQVIPAEKADTGPSKQPGKMESGLTPGQTLKNKPESRKDAKPDQPEKNPKEESQKPVQKPGKGLMSQAIRGRQQKYRDLATSVLEASNGNQLAGKLNSFLMELKPDSKSLGKLISHIQENGAPLPKTARPLTLRQQFELLEVAICGYLDKVCFNENDENLIRDLQPLTTGLIKAGFDMQAVYNSWNAQDVLAIVPLTDIDFVHYVLVGKMKRIN